MSDTFRSGSTVGTGAAINVSIGWLPDRVTIYNYEDADTIDVWTSAMDAGTSLTISTAVATRATNGISRYAGTTTASKGFTIGSGISEADKSLAWVAERNIP